MTSRRLAFVAVLLTSMWSTTLFSGDGVREINQACALVGCNSGDAPGFPVFITEPGSYKLTGSLDLTATPGTTAIQIAAPFVTLDLNGFEIVGPKVCTGSGPTLDCGGVENGAGVLVQAGSRAVVVRNGTVRNMGVEGIWGQADGLTIENVRAMHNARDGLRGESNAIVIDSMAIENGEDGFDFEYGSVLRGNTAIGNGDDGIEIDGTGGVVDNSTSNNNGNRGFHLAYSCKFGRNGSRENVNGDLCGGGICTSQRRYYLTLQSFVGDQVLGACADGFHLSTGHELISGSNLVWDYKLAQVGSPIQSGPEIGARGWIYLSGEVVQNVDCSGWTSTTDIAVTLDLGGFPSDPDPAISISPWRSLFQDCDVPHRAWCIEDW